MEYVSPRTRQLIHTLDFARHSFGLSINSSSKLGKAVLDKEELEKFLKNAWELYTNAIKEGLENNHLVIQHTNSSKNNVIIINTGSIVEKFGRPPLENSEVEPQEDLDLYETADQKHPRELLESDHDLMFVMKDLVVCTELQNITNYRLELEPTCIPGAEHFVRIYSVAQDKLKEIFKNSTATDFISNAVKNAFFEERNIPTSQASSLMSFVEKNCRCGGTANERTSIDIHQNGPSVNMKVTMKYNPEKVLFECDFLLALPLESWPQAAREWVTRDRKIFC